MPVNKKQILRLVKLVAELKENRYPNCKSFADKMDKMDKYENVNVECSAKTIQRDIRTLKEEFGAPIEYDPKNNGYYLASHGWDFSCPALEDDEMMASVFGAKVAEDIFPEPVKSRIRKAVDTQLAVNNPDFLDTTYIKALIVASGVKVDIDPDIFRVVFEAWQKRHSIEIKYKSPDGAVSVREIEPHVLTYYNEAWYIKGFCLKSNAPRVFAIHRIKSAEMTDKTFEPDLKIVESVIDGEVFSFDKIKDVDVWLDTESAKYSKERKCKKGETIKFNKDGSAIIHFDEVAKAEIVRWVMSECGRAKVVKPPSLVKEISAAAAAISKLHPK